MRSWGKLAARVPAAACVVGFVMAAGGGCSGDDAPPGSSVEQLQQEEDGAASLDVTISDGPDEGAEEAGCRHVELMVVKNGGQQNWTASQMLSPPMQFAIPAEVYVDQPNNGYHSVLFAYTDIDGGTVTCEYDGGGKGAKNQTNFPYPLSSCSNGLDAGALAMASNVSIVSTPHRDPQRMKGRRRVVLRRLHERSNPRPSSEIPAARFMATCPHLFRQSGAGTPFEKPPTNCAKAFAGGRPSKWHSARKPSIESASTKRCICSAKY